MEEKQIKIRYNSEDFNKLKKKADKVGLSISEYQKRISKRAKVKIE